jgi:hypothetical protein
MFFVSPKILVALVSLVLFMFVFSVTPDQRASFRTFGQTERNLSRHFAVFIGKKFAVTAN